jgi:ubiquinone/menaquinone biosynthesis C-methylase UbiE
LELIGRNNLKILDFGSGAGLWSVLFGILSDGNEVYGIDHNVERINNFQKLIQYLDIDNTVTAQAGNVLNLNFVNDYFDACFANEILSHTQDLEQALSEISRTLKEGGILYISDGNNSISILSNIIRRRLHKKIECGPFDAKLFKTSDLPDALLNMRKKIIISYFKDLDDKLITVLAQKTQGMYGEQIIRACEQFINSGEIKERADFPLRNPINGEKMEYPLNPFKLKTLLREKYMIDCRILPLFFSSPNILRNIVGKFIEMTHPVSLILSPGFELVGVKKSDSQK